MYHSFLKDTKLQGKYVISPMQFDSDLKYLTEKGYTTVLMSDVINYVYNNKPLPEKPVMITCDDGYYNNYVYAFPILKKYNAKMVISPIGFYSERDSGADTLSANYSHIPWDNLREMQKTGLVEVANHSYYMHSQNGARMGIKKKIGESSEQYKIAITTDIQKMQDLCKQELSVTPTTFTYPFGAISKDSPQIIKDMGFKATLVCKSRVNNITKDKNCLYDLGRYNRPNGSSSVEFFKKIGIS
ncbi:MAG: polysaccharide deacetylase family protein [Bacillota bacterium]|nr:polysaccharide deacetylase family protein [Bacillota bacterium]